MQTNRKPMPKHLKRILFSFGFLFLVILLIISTDGPSITAPISKPTEQLPVRTLPMTMPKGMFHVVDSAMVCDDCKITAELHHILQLPPGTVSDENLERLMTQGNCSQIATDVPFKIIRRETFRVPAGPQKIAYCRMRLQNGSNSFFYIMQADISSIGSK